MEVLALTTLSHLSASAAIIFALLIISLSSAIFMLFQHKKTNANDHDHHAINIPPGNLGWPIIGETMGLAMSARRGNPENFILDRMTCHSPEAFKTSLVGQNIVVLCGPSGNKSVFSNDDKLFKFWLPPSFASCLLIDPKATIEEEAKLISEAIKVFLKPDVVHRYINTMDSITRTFLYNDELWCPNSILKVQPLVKKLVFTLSSHLFLGIEDPSLMSVIEDKVDVFVSGFYSLPINFPGTSFRRTVKAAEFLRAEIVEIVLEERARHAASSGQDNNGRRCLLSHLLSTRDSEGKCLDEVKIASMVWAVLVASHDTVISLMTNVMFFLADHRDAYNKAMREQGDIKRSRDPEKLLTWEDTQKMKYCRNVISEVLRLSPAIGGFRETLQDVTHGGFTIPKGWKVLWSPLSTHKNPKYFPDPERFDPRRFEEEKKKPDPFTYVPFGGGPHMCPGYEYARQAALVFMHNLLVRFEWEKLIPDEKIVFTPLAAPQYGLPIKLRLRSEEEDDTPIRKKL